MKVENGMKKNFKSYGARHRYKLGSKQRTFINRTIIEASESVPENGLHELPEIHCGIEEYS